MVERITRLDDIDNSLQADETIRFVYRGKVFDIDLNKKNITEFDKVMEPWIAVARDMTPVPRSQSRSTGRSDGGDKDYDAGIVRAWARANNIPVNEKGRVSAEVVSKWREAGSPTV